MLTARLLNPNATVNSFKVLSAQDFYAGAPLALVLRLFDTNEQERHIPPATATVRLLFNKVDGTTLSKNATINVDDRSFISVKLTPAETAEIYGGNVLLEVDTLGDGTAVEKGIISNVLRLNTISN